MVEWFYTKTSCTIYKYYNIPYILHTMIHNSNIWQKWLIYVWNRLYIIQITYAGKDEWCLKNPKTNDVLQFQLIKNSNLP